jgi:hypothetical protein
VPCKRRIGIGHQGGAGTSRRAVVDDVAGSGVSGWSQPPARSGLPEPYSSAAMPERSTSRMCALRSELLLEECEAQGVVAGTVRLSVTSRHFPAVGLSPEARRSEGLFLSLSAHSVPRTLLSPADDPVQSR